VNEEFDSDDEIDQDVDPGVAPDVDLGVAPGVDLGVAPDTEVDLNDYDDVYTLDVCVGNHVACVFFPRDIERQ
jgi:hypothetical protein